MLAEVEAFCRSIWEAFEVDKLRAVALRNVGSFPVGGDYDILIHPDDRRRACIRIAELAERAGWRMLFDERVSNHHHLGYWRTGQHSEKSPLSLHLDLQDALGRKGFLYARAERFVSESLLQDGVPVLRPEAYTVALALHTLLDKETVSHDYRGAMQSRAAQELEPFCASVLPRNAAHSVCKWIRAGAPEAEVTKVSKILRRALTKRYPLNLGRPALVRLRRQMAYFGRRRGVLIAFLGPDGAGKSTILNAARILCPDGPFPVRAVYMGKRDAFLPTSRLIRYFYRHHQEPGSEARKSVPRRGLSSFLFHIKDLAGLANWILEQWARYLIQVRPTLQQSGIVLTDRYAFDLGSRDADSLAHSQIFRRFLPHLFPVPDCTYLLWEEPQILYLRKKDLTPDQAAEILRRLRMIVRHIPRSREIRTNRSVAVISAEIAQEIASIMESRCKT